MLGCLSQLADFGVRDVRGHRDAVAAIARTAVVEADRPGRRVPRRRVCAGPPWTANVPGYLGRHDVPERGCGHVVLASLRHGPGMGDLDANDSRVRPTPDVTGCRTYVTMCNDVRFRVAAPPDDLSSAHDRRHRHHHRIVEDDDDIRTQLASYLEERATAWPPSMAPASTGSSRRGARPKPRRARLDAARGRRAVDLPPPA